MIRATAFFWYGYRVISGDNPGNSRKEPSKFLRRTQPNLFSNIVSSLSFLSLSFHTHFLNSFISFCCFSKAATVSSLLITRFFPEAFDGQLTTSVTETVFMFNVFSKICSAPIFLVPYVFVTAILLPYLSFSGISHVPVISSCLVFLKRS